jgi:hypothetical protein
MYMGDGRMWRGVLTMLVVSTLGTLYGCSEEPTEINALTNSFVPGGVVVKDTTLQAVSGTTTKRFIPMNGNINLLGRSGGYTAYMLVQHYSALFPNRDTIKVVSAKLKLHGVTWFGQPSGTLAFDVHKITRSWNEYSVTWDSVQTDFYESAINRGTYSAPLGQDTAQVVVSLDTAMVRAWLQPNTITSYGIILIPTAGSTVVRGFTEFGFDSTQFYPSLEVIATNIAGTVRDTTNFALGIDTFVGNVDLPNDPENLYLQSGVVYRSNLVFDVSFIPRGAIINSADLIVQRNPALFNFTKFSGDTLIATHTSLSDSTFELTTAVGGRVSGTSYTFSINIRRPAQLWINGTNHGVTLRTINASEFNSFDLLTFYGPAAADPELRPKLKLVYTRKAE